MTGQARPLVPVTGASSGIGFRLAEQLATLTTRTARWLRQR